MIYKNIAYRISRIKRASRRVRPGQPYEQTCGLRLTMDDVRNAIADILDNTTLSDVTKRQGLVRKKLKSK